MAEAGLGKSAFAANLAIKLDAPIFFFSEAEGRTDPAKCWAHLTADLVGRFNLDLKLLPKRVLAGDPALFSEILRQIFSKDSETIWIIIDALDEAKPPAPGHNVINLPTSLPKGVYIVLTYRPGVPPPYVTTTPLHVHFIDQRDAEQGRTMIAYLEMVASSPNIQQLLGAATPSITKDSFIRRLMEASENNFMYVRYVVADLSTQTPDGFATFIQGALDALPSGLYGYYNRFWSYLKTTDDELWETVNHPLLSLLSAAREPVSTDWLTKHTKLQKIRVIAVLDRWERFLSSRVDGKEHRWRFIHQSFIDFLKDKGVVIEAHEKIAQQYFESWGGLSNGLTNISSVDWTQSFNKYGISHIVSHLVETGDTESIYTLLSLECSEPMSGTGNDVSSYNIWYRAHSSASILDKFLDDVQLAWREFERRSIMDLAEGRPATMVGKEAFCGLLSASIRTAFSHVPSALLPHLLEHNVITPREAFFQALNNKEDQHGSHELLQLAHVANGTLLQLILDCIEEAPQKHGGMLGPLAPNIPADLFDRAVALAHNIDEPLTRGVVFLSLKEHAPQGNATQFIAFVKETFKELKEPANQVYLLNHLHKHLQLQETEKLASQSLEQICGTDVMERIKPLTGLMHLLPQSEKGRALELALESAKANKRYGDKIADESGGTDYILAWADDYRDDRYYQPLHHLISEFVQYRLDLILEESRNTENTSFLSDIVKALPYPKNVEILQEAFEVNASGPYAFSNLAASTSPEAWAKGLTLASQGSGDDKLSYIYNLSNELSAEQTQQVLTIIEGITTPYDRSRALAQVLKLVSHDERKRVSSLLHNSLSNVGEEHLVLSILRETLPYQDKLDKNQFMTALRELKAGHKQVNMYEKFAVTAPYLNETFSSQELEDILAYEDAIQRPWYRIAEALASQFSEDQFEKLLLTASAKADSPSQSFEVIVRLVKARGKPMRASLQKITMDAALASEGYINDRAVSKLVGSLIGPLNKGILRSAFEASRIIKDQEAAVEAIVELIPFVSKNILDEVIAFVREYGSALKLARVAMVCDDQRQLKLLSESIEKGNYNWGRYQTKVDSDLQIFELLPTQLAENFIPVVSGKLDSLSHDSREDLALSFVRSLPKPLEQSVLQLANTTEDLQHRARFFAEVLPYLERKTQLQVADALILGKELSADIRYQCKLLPQLLAVCEESKRQQVLSFVQELVSLKAIDDSDSYLTKRIITSLQPLAETSPAIASTIRTLAEGIEKPYDRFKVLTEVLQPVDIEGAKRALLSALAEATNEQERNFLLQDLAPSLGRELAEFALQKFKSIYGASSIETLTFTQLTKVTEISSAEVITAVHKEYDPSIYIQASAALNGTSSVQLMKEGLELFKERLDNERDDSDEIRRELTFTIDGVAPQIGIDALTYLVHSIFDLTQFNVPLLLKALGPRLNRARLIHLLDWADELPSELNKALIIYELAPYLERESLLTDQDLLETAQVMLSYQGLSNQDKVLVELLLKRSHGDMHQLWSKVAQSSLSRVEYGVRFQSRQDFFLF